MTPPLTPIEAAEKLEALAEFFETAKGGWRDNDAALLRASASLLRQMSGALENIAWATPEKTAFAPDKLWEVQAATARAALTPRVEVQP